MPTRPSSARVPGGELAGLLELAHQRHRDDDEIGVLSRRDDVAQLAGGADGEIELLAGLARIVVDDLGDQPAHRAGGDHLDIGGVGGRRSENGGDADKARETTEHVSPCPAVVSGRCAGLPVAARGHYSRSTAAVTPRTKRVSFTPSLHQPPVRLLEPHDALLERADDRRRCRAGGRSPGCARRPRGPHGRSCGSSARTTSRRSGSMRGRKRSSSGERSAGKRRRVEPGADYRAVVGDRHVLLDDAEPELPVGAEVRQDQRRHDLEDAVIGRAERAVPAFRRHLLERLRIGMADRGADAAPEPRIGDVVAPEIAELAERAGVHGDAVIVVEGDVEAELPVRLDRV